MRVSLSLSHKHIYTHTPSHPHSPTHTHRVIPIEGSRISAALWGPLIDEFLITGHEDGSICRYDVTRVRIRLCEYIIFSITVKCVSLCCWSNDCVVVFSKWYILRPNNQQN